MSENSVKMAMRAFMSRIRRRQTSPNLAERSMKVAVRSSVCRIPEHQQYWATASAYIPWEEEGGEEEEGGRKWSGIWRRSMYCPGRSYRPGIPLGMEGVQGQAQERGSSA